MSKVMVMDHPLIQHKIGIIRRMETGSKEFREMIGEIAMLMCYEATRDLKLVDVNIETPICEMTAKELAGKKLAVVPILRAGLGMVDGMLQKWGISAFTETLRHWSLWNTTVSFRQTHQSVRYLW